MERELNKKKFLQLLEAERILNKLQREREEKKQKTKEKGKILCLHCGAIVRIPVSKKSGYGVVFTCFNCRCKYFVDEPEDAPETIQEIAESAEKLVEELEVMKTENFDTLKDNKEDESGDRYDLYFVHIP